MFFMVLVVVVLFVVVKPFSFQQKELEKTIAVLPFIDDSQETGNTYIINGLMDEILDKLHKIQDLRVKSRTDSEKYRDSKKSAVEIANELGVNYILEGSGQKIDDEIKLRIQLIDATTGDQLWSKTFTESTEDIFILQENVALSVASALKISITGKVEQQIKKLPTENMAAYNLYLKGVEYYRIGEFYASSLDWDKNRENNFKAKEMFLEAIALDSTFSLAYINLGFFFIEKEYYSINSAPEKLACLDSGFYYTNKALEYDESLNWAKQLVVTYYERKGMNKEAREMQNQIEKSEVPEYNEYGSMAYDYYNKHDYYNAIKSYFSYKKLKPDDEITPFYIINSMKKTYRDAGFFDYAENVINEMLMLNSDTSDYFSNMVALEINKGNLQKAMEYSQKAYEKDSTQSFLLMIVYFYMRDYDNASKYLPEAVTIEKEQQGKVAPSYYYGVVYLKNKKQKEAEKHLYGNAEKHQEEIDSNLPRAQHYESHVYCFLNYLALGQKDKAFGYLREMKKMDVVPNWVIVYLKYWPALDEIRDDPVFIDVLSTLEARFQKEHKRIEELWLEYGEIE